MALYKQLISLGRGSNISVLFLKFSEPQQRTRSLREPGHSQEARHSGSYHQNHIRFQLSGCLSALLPQFPMHKLILLGATFNVLPKTQKAPSIMRPDVLGSNSTSATAFTCVTSGQLPNLCEPQFPHLKHWNDPTIWGLSEGHHDNKAPSTR